MDVIFTVIGEVVILKANNERSMLRLGWNTYNDITNVLYVWVEEESRSPALIHERK